MRGVFGWASGVADDCRLTEGATLAGIGTGGSGSGGDGGAAGVGAGATATTVGIGTGSIDGFSTATSGGVTVGGVCAICVGSATDGNGGIGLVPSACGFGGGSGWNCGGTGCAACTACSDKAGGGKPTGLGCSICTGNALGKVTGGSGAATGCGFSAAAVLVCATTGVFTGAGAGGCWLTATGAAVDASCVTRTACWVLPRWVGPCSLGGTPRTGGGGGGIGLLLMMRTSSGEPFGSGGGGVRS